MPKVTGTRRQRARELYERLARGPVFDAIGDAHLHADAARIYRLWVETWVLSELKDLVPELRGDRDAR